MVMIQLRSLTSFGLGIHVSRPSEPVFSYKLPILVSFAIKKADYLNQC